MLIVRKAVTYTLSLFAGPIKYYSVLSSIKSDCVQYPTKQAFLCLEEQGVPMVEPLFCR